MSLQCNLLSIISELSKIQYFVCSPLLLITASMCLGILFVRFWQYYFEVSLAQTSFITLANSGALDGCRSDTLSFNSSHRFSIRLRSGLFLAIQENFVLRQKFSCNFGTVAWCSIMHENIAVMNFHMKFEVV